MYVKDPENYTFNREEIDRIPYMAPGLVGKEKAAQGQAAHRYLVAHHRQPDRPEKTGYPTQKPLGILRRMIAASSNPGDLVLDFFAGGAGTTGAVALELERNFLLVDNNPEAIEVMKKRFAGQPVEFETFTEGA